MSDVREIKKEIRSLLEDDNLEPKDRLKAIEVWTKILMVEHKITEGDRSDGSFFAAAPKRSRKKPP